MNLKNEMILILSSIIQLCRIHPSITSTLEINLKPSVTFHQNLFFNEFGSMKSKLSHSLLIFLTLSSHDKITPYKTVIDYKKEGILSKSPY